MQKCLYNCPPDYVCTYGKSSNGCKQTPKSQIKQDDARQKCLASCASFYVCSWENGRCIKRIASQGDNDMRAIDWARQLSDRFVRLDSDSQPLEARSSTDFDGRQISKVDLRNGLSKDQPYIRLDVPIKDLVAGESVKIELGGDFPLQEIILTAGKDIPDGGVVLEGAVPGPLRGPRARKLPVDDIPPPPKGDVLDFFTLNEYLGQDKIADAQHQVFEEALFNWKVPVKETEPGTVYFGSNIPAERVAGGNRPLNVRYAMLHYSGKAWEELPTILDWCKNGYCSYTTDPGAGGFYAIVEEKEESNPLVWVIGPLILLVGALILLAVAGSAYIFALKAIPPKGKLNAVKIACLGIFISSMIIIYLSLVAAIVFGMATIVK